MCVCVCVCVCVCICVCVCVCVCFSITQGQQKPVDTTYNFSYRPVKYLLDALFPCFGYFLMFL